MDRTLRVLAALACLLLAAPAAAVPILLQLDGVLVGGGTTSATVTWAGGFPIAGSGDIDFGLGTGALSLADHTIEIDLDSNGLGVDAEIDVTGWGQTITAIDGSGNITSTGTGSYSCLFPIAICTVGPPPDTGWPPADGNVASSAVIDTGAQKITVIDNSADATAGSFTYSFSYTIVPEPGTAALMGGALVALALLRRRSRRGS